MITEKQIQELEAAARLVNSLFWSLSVNKDGTFLFESFDYIALASPDVILALIEMVRRLEKQCLCLQIRKENQGEKS